MEEMFPSFSSINLSTPLSIGKVRSYDLSEDSVLIENEERYSKSNCSVTSSQNFNFGTKKSMLPVSGSEENYSSNCNAMYSEKIYFIEKSIQLLKTESKYARESSEKLKKEIKNNIDDNICLLKKRETALCLQVDALYNHQNSLIHEQLFKLYGALGSCHAVIESLPHCNEPSVLKRALHNPYYSESTSCFTPQKFQFVANEDIKPMIQSYGKLVNIKGQKEIFVLPDADSDEEKQQILSKIAIKETFEKVDIGRENKVKRFKSDVSSPQVILKQAFADQFNKSINFLNTTEPCLSPPSSVDSFEVVMLEKDDQKPEELKTCHCNLPSDMDIESLGELSCTSHATQKTNGITEWLKQSNIVSPSNDPVIAVPPVKELCKAHSSCSSYSACICTDNCLVSHLKEQLESIRLSNDSFYKQELNNTINSVIRAEAQKRDAVPSINMDQNIDSWLVPISSKSLPLGATNWLAKSSTASRSTTNDVKSLVKELFSCYFAGGSTEKWLTKPSVKNVDVKMC